MNYHKIDECSISNGIGIRTVLWVSGCTHHCAKCHNPETWDFSSGQLFDTQAKNHLYDCLSKPYVHGITLSGGDPIVDNNLHDVYELIVDIQIRFPNKTIWLYTGYTLHDSDFGEINGLRINAEQDYYWYYIIQHCDIIVDGEYIEELRDLTLPFRGSSNQRIIDVHKSLKQRRIALWGNTNE